MIKPVYLLSIYQFLLRKEKKYLGKEDIFEIKNEDNLN